MSGEGDDAPSLPEDVQDDYSRFPEESRLASGASRLEFERTKDVLARVLPRPPCRVVDGLSRNLAKDPVFRAIRDRDLQEGQHRNRTGNLDYFTTAYFHRPEDLVREIRSAGFEDAFVLGVEGPAWILSDFDARWDDGEQRRDLLDLLRALEREPSILGASAHLLGIGRKA